MSKKEGSYSVIGSGDSNEPLSLVPKAKVGKEATPTPVVAREPVIQQQQQSTSAPTIAQPKKVVASKKTASSSSKKPPATTTAAAAGESKDDQEDEEGEEGEEDQEEIIPHKVPESESDGEDEPPSKAGPISPTKSASGAREKTFLSEVDLEELKPAAFDTPAPTDKQAERAAEEAAIAAADAAAAASNFAKRTEWSTEASDHSTTEVFCATWSPDSRFLAVGCGDGSIRVFNASTGKIAYLLRSASSMALGGGSAATGSSPFPGYASYQGSDESLPITCIRFRPTGGGGESSASKTKNVLLATCADGTITHWHMMSQTCLYSIQEQQDTSDSQVYACDYRQDGEQFATGGRDGKVRLYDETTKALSATLTAGRGDKGTGHSNRVYVVKYHPKDQNIVISGGWDKYGHTTIVRSSTIQVWDCRAGYSIRSFYGPHLCGDALDISPDGHTILTGSWRPSETLQRWDFATGEKMDTIPFAAGPGGLGADRPELLYAASFSPDGTLIAAGGCGTHETKVFTNTATPKVVEKISAGKGGVYCVAFAPSGKKLAIGGGGPMVTIVDL